MVIELNEISFREIEAMLIRNRIHYYLFCRMVETGVIIKYARYHSVVGQGFSARLYTDLTTGIDKEYNVRVQYCDNTRCWEMIIPTQVPEILINAIKVRYGR